MQQQRLALIGTNVAGQYLDAVAGKIERNQNEDAAGKCPAESIQDCRKDCRGHAGEQIDDKMNGCQCKQLHPVKCSKFSFQSGRRIRYSFERVRIIKLPRAAAGVAMHISSSLLVPSTFDLSLLDFFDNITQLYSRT